MKNKAAYFLITFFLFTGFLNAQKKEVIIPVIKSPYTITSPEWDAKGENFSYTVNGKTYVRDFSSLSLHDSFSSKNAQNKNQFASVNSTRIFPQVQVSVNKNKVTLTTQKNASSQIQSKEITIPEMAKEVSVNKKQDKLACTGYKENTFIYDVNKDSIILDLPQSASCKDVQFLDNDKFLFCESNKTVSLFSSSGQKIKTFTNTNNISGFSISPDNDNLVIFDDKGVLNFYSITNGKQYGYSPSISSSIIQDVSFSNDSKRVLIKTKTSLYTATVSDILYAQNTIAPSLNEFSINYNSQSADNGKNYITKFNNNNIKNFVNENDAEYITTTREKTDDNQVFSLNKKKTADEPIALLPFTEQEDFPSTAEKSGKTYYFNDSANSNPVETTTKTIVPGRKNSDSSTDYSSTSQDFSNGNNAGTGGAGIGTAGSETTGGTTSGARSVSGGSGSSTNFVMNGGSGSAGTGSSDDNGSGSSGVEEKKSTTKKSDTTKKVAEKKQKETKKVEKKENNDAKDENILEKWKAIRDFNDENIKTMFKDGHGLLFNIGVCKTEGLFPLTFIYPVGYRNYDLLRPFYFGGTLELDLSLPASDFPYKYYDSQGEQINSPVVVGFKLYAPIGACMYPLKNSFEIFGEFGVGMGFSGIWSGGVGDRMLLTKLYPSFFVNFRTGVAWDFLNLTFNFSYDAVTGMAYGVELGAIINIGGTRTIGSMIKREK